MRKDNIVVIIYRDDNSNGEDAKNEQWVQLIQNYNNDINNIVT